MRESRLSILPHVETALWIAWASLFAVLTYYGGLYGAFLSALLFIFVGLTVAGRLLTDGIAIGIWLLMGCSMIATGAVLRDLVPLKDGLPVVTGLLVQASTQKSDRRNDLRIVMQIGKKQREFVYSKNTRAGELIAALSLPMPARIWTDSRESKAVRHLEVGGKIVVDNAAARANADSYLAPFRLGSALLAMFFGFAFILRRGFTARAYPSLPLRSLFLRKR